LDAATGAASGEMMKSIEKLAAALEEAKLPEMAARARDGYYHDYISPLAIPCLQLEQDLRLAGTPAALAIRERHMNGEFDATKEESDEWIKSDDGKEVLSHLPLAMRKIFRGQS
jgi:hypothetical protein